MALQMVHLAAAYLWHPENERLHRCPEFYLGAISPDAIHAREGSTREDKRKTHLGVNAHNYVGKISELWRADSSPFAVGYGFHILTDRVWVEYYKRFRGLFDPQTGKVIPEIYYNAADQVDFMLYKTLCYRGDIWDMLSRAKARDFRGLLSAGEIEEWKQRTLHWFDRGESEHKDEIKYLTFDVISEFVARSSSLCDGALQSENAAGMIFDEVK